MRDLVTHVRAGRFRASELTDGTITAFSLGERGVETLHGVIYPPQVAIVGFGMPPWRAWASCRRPYALELHQRLDVKSHPACARTHSPPRLT